MRGGTTSGNFDSRKTWSARELIRLLVCRRVRPATFRRGERRGNFIFASPSHRDVQCSILLDAGRLLTMDKRGSKFSSCASIDDKSQPLGSLTGVSFDFNGVTFIYRRHTILTPGRVIILCTYAPLHVFSDQMQLRSLSP